MIEAGKSSVVTYRPDGTQPRHLGALAHVEALSYGWTNPGGADQMTCILEQPATWRTDALNPGRIVKVFRGGSVVWDGKLQEAQASATGWTVTGVGVGNMGNDFLAYYTATWGSAGQQNEAVNRAITRGLRWVNPGNTGTPFLNGSIPSGVWFGQPVDPAADNITALLNLFATKGTYTWYVRTSPAGPPGQNQNILSVYALPTPNRANANRILTSAQPVSRTLGGDVNTIFIRYQTSADGATTATFGLNQVTTPGAAALHGVLEEFVDISSDGQATSTIANNAANSILARYQRVSFGNPFTVRYGELLNIGGAPCDLGIDHSGTIVQLMLTDFGYGGEVVPNPVYFMIGSYVYDDAAETAQVTAFQSLNLSISSLLSMLSTTFKGKTAQPPKPPPKVHHKKKHVSRAAAEAAQDARQRARWRKHHPHAKPKPPGFF